MGYPNECAVDLLGLMGYATLSKNVHFIVGLQLKCIVVLKKLTCVNVSNW